MQILDFYADWCQPCKQLKPVIDSLEKEYTEVAFTKVNIDKDEETTQQYGIMSIPTLIIKNGDVIIKQLTGSEISRKAVVEALV